MEVNANLTLKLAGTKTFRDGIIGTADLTQDDVCGQFIITGLTAQLGGTGAINLNTNGAAINAGATTMISDKVINLTAGLGTLTLSAGGIFNCDAYNITGTSIFTMVGNATLRLGSPGGISSSGGSADEES